MESIIITVTNGEKTFCYDLDVPIEINCVDLKQDIIESINGANPMLMINPVSSHLFSKRLEREICDDETLVDAGVVNGDFLIIS